MTSHFVHAIIYVLPALTAHVGALTDIGRACGMRRGYRSVMVSRDWAEVEQLLWTRAAHTVVLASSAWLADLASARTVRIPGRYGGKRTIVTGAASCAVPRPDNTIVTLPARARGGGRHRAPSDSLIGRVVRHPTLEARPVTDARVRRVLEGAEPAPGDVAPETVAALRSLWRQISDRP